MQPETTAIVFQGLQVEFCSPEGKLYPLVQQQLHERNFLPKILDLLDRAMELGVRVYCVPIVFTPDYREIKNAEGILGAIRDAGAFKRGARGADPIDAILPLLPRMQVLDAKRGLCAFGSTDLDERLAKDGIRTVAVAGLLTNVCVETTARTAYDLGYRVITLTDVTATKSQEEQEASEKYMFPLLGSLQTSEEFLADVSGFGLAAAAGK